MRSHVFCVHQRGKQSVSHSLEVLHLVWQGSEEASAEKYQVHE